jgi:hypothetical protein
MLCGFENLLRTKIIFFTSLEEKLQILSIGNGVFNRWIILRRRRYQRVPAAAQDSPDGGGRRRTQRPGGRTLSAGSQARLGRLSGRPHPLPPHQIGAVCATVECITTNRGSSTIEPVLGIRVFRLPGSGFISQRYGFGSGSFPFLIKMLSGLK